MPSYRASRWEPAGKARVDEGRILALQRINRQRSGPSAARSRTAMLSGDVSAEAHYAANPHRPLTRSELALPMIVGSKLVGVLDFQSEQVNRFSEDDVRVMTSLAEQIAIAVNNAHLYAEQVQVAERLRELDNMKSSFLASMSHELRTPLNGILNFSKFVSTGMLGPVNEKQVGALGKSIDCAKHLLNLINDVLDITKIESKMLSVLSNRTLT
jgi:signal transduction histidine kinase